jgi:hypothetical protein
MTRRARRCSQVLVAALALGAGALAPGGASHAAAPSPTCTGDLSAIGVPQKPGPAVRFGITPAGEAGALGPHVAPVPEQPDKTNAALAQLQAPGTHLVLRLNRFFWSDGEAGMQRFLALAKRFTSLGYLVELQVRYHPTAAQEGNIPAWVAHVRDVVDRFGANPGVVALQITNEVNFTISPDSSDGAYKGAQDALVQGVIAAKDEARKRGYDQLAIGFNWFWRLDPATETSFWSSLRDKGGAAFVAAVDWVGLDAYPGTVFPPAEVPGGYRDAMVTALSELRRCYMTIPGIPASVPIHVEENGWPTGPGRAEATQASAMREMVGAVNDFRGTYNVSDYRWFDLRDHNTSSVNFQHHYGLLTDDYTPKPAFAVYKELIARFARRDPAAAPAPALRLRAYCSRRHVRVTLVGRDLAKVRSVLLRAAGHAATDRTRPFTRRLRLTTHDPSRPAASAVAQLRGGATVRLSRRVRCG